MSKKLLKIIMNVFFLFLFIPTIVMAMDFSDEKPTERTRLTSWQLRENVKAVEAEWWQSVEVITPRKDLCEWEGGQWKNKSLNWLKCPSDAKWGTSDANWGGEPYCAGSLRTVFCCFSIRRSDSDLVVLEDYRRSVVMFLKDAREIMQRENKETQKLINKEIEDYKEYKKKDTEKYEQEKKFLDYEKATYQGSSLFYLNDQKRKELHPKTLEDWKKADSLREKREAQKRYDEEGKKPEVQLKRAIEAQTKAIEAQTELMKKQRAEEAERRGRGVFLSHYSCTPACCNAGAPHACPRLSSARR